MEELEIIDRWDIPGVRIFLNTVEYRTAHFHGEWEMLWVLENSLDIHTLQQVFRADAGQIALLSPNMPHELRKLEKGCTFLCFQVSKNLFPGIDNLVIEGTIIDAFMDTERLRRALYQCAWTYFGRERFYEMKVMGQMSQIFYDIFTTIPSHSISQKEARSREEQNARLLRLQKYVDGNYMHKIRLADFAKEEGCSVSSLSRFVRDCLNQTFQEYVTSVRFNSACQLIAAGNSKMLDVCMESGFSDYRYFTRAFRHYCGMTPEAYCRSQDVRQWENVPTRRSVRSLERFYTNAQSHQLLQTLAEEKIE